VSELNKGRIHQIIGPVIDIKFESEKMPELLNAIKIPFGDKTVTAEVAQHIGDDVVRTVALSSTDGLTRGMEAIDTGRPHRNLCRERSVGQAVQCHW
jgi:F-type H+/Na+-transporting ATPase subunit beta